MSGRWGGDIKGRRRGSSDRRRRDWLAPRVKPEAPRMETRLRAGAMLAASGFYMVTVAGALLAFA